MVVLPSGVQRASSLLLSPLPPTLSAVTKAERVGGSGDSSGNDARWTPEGRTTTYDSLFDAREVGLCVGERASVGGVGVPATPPARLPERKGGDGNSEGLGLGFEGEITHLRLALLCEGDGVWCCRKKGEISTPSRYCTARGAEAAPGQAFNQI